MRAGGKLLRGGFLAAALACLAGTALAACPVPPRGRTLPAEATAAEVPWPPWRVVVDSMTERLRRSDVSSTRLLFLGDSIVEGWSAEGWQGLIYRQFYAHRSPLNLGIGGDSTQGMLWRLEHGHWPAALRPQLIVLLIGTNNLGFGSKPEDVALGISEIIARLQQLSPSSRILLLGILPRGASPADPARPLVERTNQLIASCADRQRVFFANPGPMLLDGAGNLPEHISFDGLHLTLVGYAILSTAIEGTVQQVLGR